MLYNHPMKIDLYGHPFKCIELCACNARQSAWHAMKGAPPDWRELSS